MQVNIYLLVIKLTITRIHNYCKTCTFPTHKKEEKKSVNVLRKDYEENFIKEEF